MREGNSEAKEEVGVAKGEKDMLQRVMDICDINEESSFFVPDYREKIEESVVVIKEKEFLSLLVFNVTCNDSSVIYVTAQNDVQAD